jgi:DNA-binding PadR family transcriptional regulator
MGRRKQTEGQSLSPAMLHILLVLAAGEQHGYGMMQEIAALTEGQMRIGPGTLYRSLKEMLGAGLIEESEERPDPALDDERRRYYRLTAEGRRQLRAEVSRLARLVEVARTRELGTGDA